MKFKFARWLVGTIGVYVLAFSALVAAQSPSIQNVAPPNWWINYTPEVTLLLTGGNLTGARVTSDSNAASVTHVDTSANGHYLFVRLKLSGSRPQTVQLTISNQMGSASAKLTLLARADNHGRFEGFSRDDVIYLIMPDRFADGDPSNDQPAGSNGLYDRNNPMAYHGGDLRGIRDHLGYLHSLGVSTLWLTPVWKNADSDYHGYHVVDFYSLDEHMGSMQEYQSLVADAHKLGMKVLIDYVVNHTGPHHPWANDPPTPTWLHGTPAHHRKPSYSFNGLVDPHASPREYLDTLDGWFVDKLPDLNPDDPALATYLAQNAMWWTEMAQLDGIRLDTFPYSTRQFWSGWHERYREIYPHVNDVGEVADHDPVITSFFAGGKRQFDGVDSGVSTVFDFPLCYALRDVIIKGASLEKLIDVLRHDELYPHPEALVTFFGNHDDRRFVSEKESSPAKLKAAFSLLLTLRGIPQIYSGDEIGMQGGDDPDNRRDFPGGFPGDPQNAFTPSGRNPEQQDMFDHVQSLLALRKAHPALRTGKQSNIGWDDSYYAFVRELSDERLLIVYNNSSSSRELKIPVKDTALESAQQLHLLFGGTELRKPEISTGEFHITMPGQTLAVFDLR